MFANIYYPFTCTQTYSTILFLVHFDSNCTYHLQEIWSFNLGATVGGVAVDERYAYVTRSGSQIVTVLDKHTGSQVRTFKFVNSAAISSTFSLTVHKNIAF